MEFKFTEPLELLASLDAVPFEYQRLYTLNKDGLYELTERTRTDFGELRAERDALTKKYANDVAALDAKAAGLVQNVNEVRIDGAVRDALVALGLKPQFVKGFSLVFLQDYECEVREKDDGSYTVVVVDDAGNEADIKTVARTMDGMNDPDYVLGKTTPPSHQFTRQLRGR